MKIGEIIELSKTDSLAKIAKEHLSIGKEKAREGLKKAGCYSKNGLKGWHFDGDESVLEQSIYDFVTTTRKARLETGIKTSTKTGRRKSLEKSINTGKEAIIKTRTKDSNIEGQEQAKKEASKEIAASLETGTKTSTNASTDTDILDRLYAGIETMEDKKEISFYLTHDVIEVISRTKKGYRSDLVNEALRKVFREKGWM